MLPGGAGGLTVDGGRALRLAAVVVLAVLGITTLPDLFQAPAPPPIPADVGFRPGETTAGTPTYPEAEPARETARDRTGKKGANRKPNGGPAAEGRGRGRKSADPGKGSGGRARPDDDPGQTAAPVAPAPVAIPAPPPPPVTPSPAVPADGSEEFAPGLAG